VTNRLKKVVLALAALAALALGGSAIAGAVSGDGGDEKTGAPLSGEEASHAKDAAAAKTGGTPGQVERDGENGATYEVEVTRGNGTRADVRLDDQFKVVTVEEDDGE
jgi:uncharacterized membrane protein YkoI